MPIAYRGPVAPRLLVGLAALLTAASIACATQGRGSACRIEVTALESYEVRRGDVSIAYRVRGQAEAGGKVWLAAQTVEGPWISGGALEVGPGSFAAIVDLRLTGRARRYKALLEVAGRRCADDAPRPGG